MPAEKGFDKYHLPGRLRPLKERRAEIDVTSYPQVRDHLKRQIPDFKKRFGRYDNVLQVWHGVRIAISNLPLDENFSQKAGELRSEFQTPYDDPTSAQYNPELLFTLEPVLKIITNLIANRR